MGTLMRAPKKAFEQGGARLAARIEVQLATGTRFKPYPGVSDANENTVPWVERE